MATETISTTATHDAHLRDAQELAQAHGVDPDTGLHADEATRRAAQHGANELQDHARRGPLALLIEQFKDFMVLVLLGAAVVSGLVGEATDTVVILVIVVLNALIGFMQAWRADQAMAALRLLAAAQCRSSPPQSWCPATSCCWRRATRSRPTCDSSRLRSYRWTNRPSRVNP